MPQAAGILIVCLFLSAYVDSELLKDIRDNTRKGMAVGGNRFKEKIEAMTGRRLKSKQRGRPVGWRKDNILTI